MKWGQLRWAKQYERSFSQCRGDRRRASPVPYCDVSLESAPDAGRRRRGTAACIEHGPVTHTRKWAPPPPIITGLDLNRSYRRSMAAHIGWLKTREW